VLVELWPILAGRLWQHVLQIDNLLVIIRNKPRCSFILGSHFKGAKVIACELGFRHRSRLERLAKFLVQGNGVTYLLAYPGGISDFPNKYLMRCIRQNFINGTPTCV